MHSSDQTKPVAIENTFHELQYSPPPVWYNPWLNVSLTQHQKSNNQFSNGFPILLKWPEPESFVQTQYRMHSEHGFQSQAMHSLILSSAYSCNEIDRAICSAQSQNILNSVHAKPHSWYRHHEMEFQ
ncbi:hypothetical protein A1S_0517 [Acinetobacter baumannii ATCC 17978]|nr:hypothetical protein A1S_0517 [Acinetobacter baumannii ATCC 17978]